MEAKTAIEKTGLVCKACGKKIKEKAGHHVTKNGQIFCSTYCLVEFLGIGEK